MSIKAFMVPGMFSPFINTFLGTYFIDQIEYLARQGVESIVMPIHTEGTIGINAEIIRENALQHEEIIAFCHSKGGIDLLHALLVYPEIRPRFKQVIFLQSPFFGTPLADFVTTNDFATKLTSIIFKTLLNGDKTSILELTTLERSSYMAHYAQEIRELVQSVPMACYASAKSFESGRFDSILKITRDFIQFRYKLANDGMIPTHSGFLPHLDANHLGDVDHASAVIRLTPQHYNREHFNQQIFSGVLS